MKPERYKNVYFVTTETIYDNANEMYEIMDRKRHEDFINEYHDFEGNGA